MQPKPKAVIISDIHYSLQTLELADAALRQAIAKANELEVPLIIAGDLHDTKANLRGECINAMLETFELLNTSCYIMKGNHDSINEKSDKNAVEFLDAPRTDSGFQRTVVNHIKLIHFRQSSLYLVPYHHDLTELRTYLKTIPKGSTVIMHQGIQGSDAGHYMQDPTALTHADVAYFNVISGHYHRRQTIKTGKGNTFSYIGNPYTLNFGEANDPEKGYQILNDDGTLTFVPTNLRKHVVIKLDLGTEEQEWSNGPIHKTDKRNDLVLVKATGTKDQQRRFDRIAWCKEYGIVNDFRLDFITNDETIELGDRSNQTQSEIMDSLIDALPDEAPKESLKALWRSLNETNQGRS